MDSFVEDRAVSGADKGGAPPGALRVVGYIRVSTQEQSDSGAGLQAQAAAIEAEAAHRRWELVHIFEDAGASGKSVSGRPGLQAALAALERDEAAMLLVAKVDRLSRSVSDFSRLLERYPKRLHVLDLGIDLASPYGEMVATVVSAMAQLERRLVAERTRSALAVKRAQGVTLGRPREMSPEAVERIHELHCLGYRPAQIAAKLNEEGVPTPRNGRWHPPGVARVLSWQNAA